MLNLDLKNPMASILARHAGQFHTQPNEGDEDDKEKQKKVKIPFYLLSQEEREVVFRITSAKHEKKRQEEIKNRKEDLEWKAQAKQQKMATVQQRKRQKDQEEEAYREKKLQHFN